MHGRGIVAAIGFLAAVVATGCDSLSPRAQGQLNLGCQQYQAGDNVGAVAQMDAFIQENSRAKRIDEAYYIRGLARYNLHQYDSAKADLLQAVTQTKNPELMGKSAMALGDLSYKTGDMTLAENMYRHAVASLESYYRQTTGSPAPPDNLLLAQGYYRLGCVLQRQSKWRDADQQFHKAIYFYPNIEPGKRAARVINATAWTVQAGSFSRMAAAQADTKRFVAKDLPARAAAVLSGGAALYVVQVGRYDRFEDAQAMLPQVRQIQADALVTPTR